jgi:hypothetical protein
MLTIESGERLPKNCAEQSNASPYVLVVAAARGLGDA